jgi:hypothetical protein
MDGAKTTVDLTAGMLTQVKAGTKLEELSSYQHSLHTLMFEEMPVSFMNVFGGAVKRTDLMKSPTVRLISF